jgi:hypothetical protein
MRSFSPQFAEDRSGVGAEHRRGGDVADSRLGERGPRRGHLADAWLADQPDDGTG